MQYINRRKEELEEEKTTRKTRKCDTSDEEAFNQELEREREYDHEELDLVVQTNVTLLNSQQKEVYDT